METKKLHLLFYELILLVFSDLFVLKIFFWFYLITDDEYRLFVEKYATVRTEFEAKMTDACKVCKMRLLLCHCYSCPQQNPP